MTDFSFKTLIVAGLTAGAIALSAVPASAMDNNQMIRAMAIDAKISKTQAQRALNSFIANTAKALKKGERVGIVGLGFFSIKTNSGRPGRNPQTGEVIIVSGKKVVRFKAGASFKNLVK